MAVSWADARSMPSRNYVCGYCGNPIATERGYTSSSKGNIYVCHFCDQPTYFSIDGRQVPGSAFGHPVEHIPSAEVEALYEESRNCITVNAYTASILCSRKLLMNIAVSKGAAEGLHFIEYVNYLSDHGYLPPDGKEWVDQIRTKGNEATHEIKIMNRTDAEELITFVGMLLKFIYEFPAMIRNKAAAPPAAK
jgi:hypothetical protein